MRIALGIRWYKPWRGALKITYRTDLCWGKASGYVYKGHTIKDTHFYKMANIKGFIRSFIKNVSRETCFM